MQDISQITQRVSKEITTATDGPKDLTQQPETSTTLCEIEQKVVDRLFDRLKEIFPKWREIWQSDGEVKAAKRQWTKSLVKHGVADVQMIQMGIESARESGWVRPPSPGQFVKWCIESAKEKAGIPTREDANTEVMKMARLGEYRRKKTMMSPPIYQMCRFIDWYDFSRLDVEKAIKAIDRAYDQMVDHWRAGRPFAEQPVMIERTNPTGVTHTRESRERGRQILDNLIKDLGNG